MKKLIVLLLMFPILSCNRVDLSTENARTSYSLGYSLTKEYYPQKKPTDPSALFKGLTDALNSNESSRGISPSDEYQNGWNMGTRIALCDVPFTTTSGNAGIQDAIDKKKPRISQDEMDRLVTKCEDIWETYQRDFLAVLNGSVTTDPALHKTESGLFYRILKEGTGVRPGPGSTVQVTYRGSLPSGEIIDSVAVQNQTHTIPLEKVIPGWQEGLQLMKEGATYLLYIPPSLAYGEKGFGSIPESTPVLYRITLKKVL